MDLPSGFTKSTKMSVPAFIDITEEDQVQQSFEILCNLALVKTLDDNKAL